jgi:predicted neuraminidase
MGISCWIRIVLGLLAVSTVSGAEPPPQSAVLQPGVVRVEFIFQRAQFAQCHASTLAETADGLVAAWFGGTSEGHPDVGIWLARRSTGAWSAPVEVANGVQMPDRRYPCWNPVLYQEPQGPLLLFYKVGPSPAAWWGMLQRSNDGGRTWSPPERLPDGQTGPIKNKPLRLASGRLLCGSSSEDHGWRVHIEWTDDLGKTWSRTGPLNDGQAFGAIQPSILRHHDGKLQILCRSRGPGRILEAWSNDSGQNWTQLAPTPLPNPNSGLDAVTLRDGRQLLVYNHTTRGRTPLNVAVSPDGRSWQSAVVLESEPGEYSYPAVIQTQDGRVHITYTWRRERIRHVELDPDQLVLRPFE